MPLAPGGMSTPISAAPQETCADMGRSRDLGFLDHRPSWSSFADLFDRLRRERIIP